MCWKDEPLNQLKMLQPGSGYTGAPNNPVRKFLRSHTVYMRSTPPPTLPHLLLTAVYRQAEVLVVSQEELLCYFEEKLKT